jgi:hypothetical protein
MDAMGIIIAVVGLVITVVVVGGAFFTIFKIFGGMKKANQERERLLREGIQANARVLSVQMGGMTMTVGVHRHLQLVIGLEVHPPGHGPYQAQMTTMVSELQIPQIQPGVMLTVRYDRTNPMKLALEGVCAAGQQQQPGYGAPGYGQPQGYAQAPGVPGSGGGAPQAGAMMPVQGMPGMPKAAKIGLVIGLIGAVVGVGVAVVVVAINVLGVGSSFASTSAGGDEASASGGGVCAQAQRCCEAIGAPPDACNNFGRIGVPDSVCSSALDGYKQAASAQGKSCD